MMEEMKKKKMRTTTVFTKTGQYNCFRWLEMEEFLTWQGGWILLRLSVKLRSRGVVVVAAVA